MKKFIWLLGGMAAAAAGFLVWSSTSTRSLKETDSHPGQQDSDDATFI